MASIKASRHGLTQIKQAIAQKGWNTYSDRWLVEASKILDSCGDWYESGPYAYGCSLQTWERFLQGTAIRDRSFIAFCQVLGLEPDAVAEVSHRLREDWGEAPDVPVFHGRRQELNTLEHWLLDDRCRLITIVGLAGVGKTRLVRGGIGKTDLSLQLARRVQGEFEYLIWRRLLNASPPEVILAELIEFVSDRQETHLSNTPEGLATQLLPYLRQRRCLVIFDNVESILQGGERAGDYRAGYEGYGEFFRRIGESEHQSCVVLTSREKPQDIEMMEGVWLVRSLELGGVDSAAGQAIFQDIGCAYNSTFKGSDDEWETLVSFYGGNPLALEVAAKHILRRFDGDLSQFLAQNLTIFGKIRDLLDWHFDRLSEAEKEVMYWLAINREPVSIADLKGDILSPFAQKYIPETLDTLERQLPIEKSGDQFTIQPVLIEYATERLIKQICQELKSGRLHLFNSHALIKASAKDHVRASQIRIILNVIIQQLASTSGLKEQNCLEHQLLQIRARLKETYQDQPGYAAGNLLNLLRYSGIDVSGHDFSHLAIRQADLQGAHLHQVNFAACEFAQSSFTQHFGGVHSIAFSPDQDLLAMGDSNGDIWLFHLKDRQPWLCLRGHNKNLSIPAMAFSPDGKWLVSGSLDLTVKLWDTHTGECLKTLTGHTKWIWTVAFSPDGQTVVSGGDDNTIRLWNIHTGDCQVIEGHCGCVLNVTVNPEGNLIASAGYDHAIRLWRLETAECFKILTGHENSIWDVAFHPNGETLASGSVDNTVKVWDVHTGECLNTLKRHTQEVYSIAFSADGQIIASGRFDRTINLWDSGTGELLKTLRGHTNGVRMITFAPDNSILASGDNDQLLKLWDVNTGECLKTWQGYINWMWTIAIAADGRLLASGSLDKAVRLWDSHTGKLINVLRGHNNWIRTVAFSPDGQILASGSDDETIKLWDVSTGQCRTTLQGYPKGGGWTVAFSPDGGLLASGGREGTIRFWDARTGDSLRCLARHSNWICSVTFSPDGQSLASCSYDQTIKLWDVKTGECRLSIQDPLSRVFAIAFHPNGQMLVSGGDDQQAKLWDISTGNCIQTFQGHAGSIQAVTFSSAGRLISSAYVDTTIRFWDVQTGQCIGVLEGHTTWVRAVVFTPDGQTIASGSTDGTIRLWDVETRQVLRVLHPKRPYEGMNIADVRGLTAAQEDALIALGANSG